MVVLRRVRKKLNWGIVIWEGVFRVVEYMIYFLVKYVIGVGRKLWSIMWSVESVWFIFVGFVLWIEMGRIFVKS